MKYINAVHDLLIAFSDLPLGDYESSLELPYIIYGECFAPYIRKMIRKLQVQVGHLHGRT